MELKDVVLSVLTDIQNEEERLMSVAKEAKAEIKPQAKDEKVPEEKPQEKKAVKVEASPRQQPAPQIKLKYPSRNDEEQFLRNLKERILVMFEGFNSPKNQNIDAKVDLTINFLEYLLSVTDERLESINATKK